jgi:hypothetical protein
MKSKPKQVCRKKRSNYTWTEEELILLETEVANYHKLSSIDWEAISKSFFNRSSQAVSIFLFLG